jgi:antitoxin ParD1/3/4
MAMNISLTPQLEEMIRQKVESGMYSSASEVVRAALRRMEEADAAREDKRNWLRHEIAKGRQSGPAIPAEDVFTELKTKFQAMADKPDEK